MPAGKPAVTANMTQCRLVVSQQPPDTTTGWRVQFRRGTGTAIGTRVNAPPYTRTSALLPVGDYEVWGEWTKSTGGIVNSDKTVISAKASVVATELPWVAAPPPPPPPPTNSYMVLGDHAWKTMTNGWGPAERNRSNGEQGAADGGPLRIRGQQFATGLGCHAPSEIVYDLPIGADLFTATLGVDDETAGNGSVQFEVWADGARLFQSPVLTSASAALPVEVSLQNQAVLRLVVVGGADITFDHADWADAKVRAPMPLVFRNTSDPDNTPNVPGPPSDYGPYDQPCPSGAVTIGVGDNWQTAVNANPVNTKFCIAAGTHRMQSVVPKSGQEFHGEYGAVMSGAVVLTGWVVDGARWYVTGQTQASGGSGVCNSNGQYPMCQSRQDLWFNDVFKRHVSSLGAVVAGTWFYDYATDRIYVGDDPSGATVETSITETAFSSGSATGVTISNLVITKYATNGQTATVQGDGGSGWTISRCDVKQNHATGIRIHSGILVTNCYIRENYQLGIGGLATNAVVRYNEISYNGQQYDEFWEAGGSKFAYNTNLWCHHNFVHHNYGPGLWTDIDNQDTLYEYNVCEDNNGPGIMHEISFRCITRYNTCRRNGAVAGWFGYGGGIWFSCAGDGGSEIHDNLVEDNFFGGIALFQEDRGGPPWLTKDVYVHHNTIRLSGTTLSGGSIVGVGNEMFTSRNNRWDYNTWNLATGPNHFAWLGATHAQAGWQGFGFDLNGTFNYF